MLGDMSTLVLCVSLAALLGLLLGFGGARLLDRARLKSVQAQVADIKSQAERDADNIRKRAEVDAKDEFFKKREDFNRETESARTELRDQERRLDKREDALEQKTEAVAKKEKALESNQRKLTERKAELDKRQEELDATLQKQAQ